MSIDSDKLLAALIGSLDLKAIKSSGKKSRVAIRDAATGELLESNRIATEWQSRHSVPHWIAVSTVVMLQTQHCSCCQNRTQYVAGLFLEQRDPLAGAARRYAKSPDLSLDPNLPLKVEYMPDEHVPYCGQCLSAVESLDHKFETWLATQVESPQMRLF